MLTLTSSFAFSMMIVRDDNFFNFNNIVSMRLVSRSALNAMNVSIAVSGLVGDSSCQSLVAALLQLEQLYTFLH